ncbi:MAG: hypothetical protein HOV96_21725 [Nonomuraea sp.]|nr:hypothetical protein [Nonomuraea sp.]NUP67639.1 hypothetical protein [Nonomuraea sp.]NUP80163.1 hypothetical protein [Nonomuraea sp.]NUS08092.1 hypothetical protein [Nonomuraea sp.]NUT09558.1 hypothetical protein [Nonomuraea sp.]
MDIADDVMPYVSAAIGAYGVATLAKTGELAAGTPQARGARILQRVFGRGDTGARKLIEQAAGGPPGLDALKGAIAEAAGADPHLRRELAAMLPQVAAQL